MSDPFRIAAMADLHYGRESTGELREAFAHASDHADVMLLCGDLTDYGRPEEAELLARDLRERMALPTLAVLGNHDFETDQAEEMSAVLADAGVKFLDGTCTEIGGVGFAGARGFAGGFGRWALSPWGEPVLKAFVQEAVNEELKLDAALSRLATPHRVVLLHYAPIRATVEGEPEEIIPFLGSSRLEDPLNRHEASVAFHGHAHMGAPAGTTSRGTRVFNVSVPVLKKHQPDRPPYLLYELDRAADGSGPSGAAAH
jgi:Icc-related predicted phosphoesterase